MLVLSRFQNERIVVGEDIVITVIRIEGEKVRLGIEAPEAVPILREELLDERLPPLSRTHRRRRR